MTVRCFVPFFLLRRSFWSWSAVGMCLSDARYVARACGASDVVSPCQPMKVASHLVPATLGLAEDWTSSDLGLMQLIPTVMM